MSLRILKYKELNVLIIAVALKIIVVSSHLRTDVRQLSVLQPPQHITRGVASDAKIKCMKRRE